MEKFEGLVLGGPLAGVWKSHHSPTMQVMDKSPTAIRFDPSVTVDPYETIKRVTYTHRFMPGRYDIWSPEEWDLTMVFHELFTGYMAGRKNEE